MDWIHHCLRASFNWMAEWLKVKNWVQIESRNSEVKFKQFERKKTIQKDIARKQSVLFFAVRLNALSINVNIYLHTLYCAIVVVSLNTRCAVFFSVNYFTRWLLLAACSLSRSPAHFNCFNVYMNINQKTVTCSEVDYNQTKRIQTNEQTNYSENRERER